MAACIFCEIVAGRAPAHVIWEDEHCLAILDIFPVSEGHVLILPREHAPLIGDLPASLRAHLLEVACHVVAAQTEAGVTAHGNNLLVNDGQAANQHVPHVHLHVIPRARGDLVRIAARLATRFFVLRGEGTKQRLEAIAARLAAAMARRAATP